ncbi:MAG: S8 family serine peptidase [Candidatus Sericytochromatia bacterium]
MAHARFFQALVLILSLASCQQAELPRPVTGALTAVSDLQLPILTEALKSHEAAQPVSALDPPRPPAAENLWWLNRTRITAAWQYNLGYSQSLGRPIRIAVIDMGFAGMHTAMEPGHDLEGQILWQEGRRIISQADLPQIDEPWTLETLAQEDQEILSGGRILNLIKSHGTSAASTMVSRLNDGQGIVGVAPQARVVPFKVGNGFKNVWAEVVQALKYIAAAPPAQKIDVISLSLWGGSARGFYEPWGPQHPGYADYLEMKRQIERLTAQGTVIVAAAGNGGWNVERNFPAGLRDSSGKALFPELISVGATQPDGSRAIFKPEAPFQRQYASNWGTGVDIWAPGQGMAAIGSGSSMFFDVHSNTRRLMASGEIVSWTGTSAATPLVAGIVALLKAQDPTLDRERILSLLQLSRQWTRYRDQRLRSHPFLATQPVLSECGYLQEDMHCGELFGGDLSMQQVDALASLEALSGSPGSVRLQGRFRPDGSLRTRSGETLSLRLGSGPVPDSFYAENLAGSQAEYLPVADLIKAGAWVQADGWRRNQTLNLLQLKVITEP